MSHVFPSFRIALRPLAILLAFGCLTAVPAEEPLPEGDAAPDAETAESVAATLEETPDSEQDVAAPPSDPLDLLEQPLRVTTRSFLWNGDVDLTEGTIPSAPDSLIQTEAYFINDGIVGLLRSPSLKERVLLNSTGVISRSETRNFDEPEYPAAVASSHNPRVLAATGLGHLWALENKARFDSSATSTLTLVELPTATPESLETANVLMPELREPRGVDNTERAMVTQADGTLLLTYRELSSQGAVLAEERVTLTFPESDEQREETQGLPARVQTLRLEADRGSEAGTLEPTLTMITDVLSVQVLKTPGTLPEVYQSLSDRDEPVLGVMEVEPLFRDDTTKVIAPLTPPKPTSLFVKPGFGILVMLGLLMVWLTWVVIRLSRR